MFVVRETLGFICIKTNHELWIYNKPQIPSCVTLMLCEKAGAEH